MVLARLSEIFRYIRICHALVVAHGVNEMIQYENIIKWDYLNSACISILYEHFYIPHFKAIRILQILISMYRLVVILHPQNHPYEGVMRGRIFEHSLPPV